jgi:hypothetical protein
MTESPFNLSKIYIMKVTVTLPGNLSVVQIYTSSSDNLIDIAISHQFDDTLAVGLYNTTNKPNVTAVGFRNNNISLVRRYYSKLLSGNYIKDLTPTTKWKIIGLGRWTGYLVLLDESHGNGTLNISLWNWATPNPPKTRYHYSNISSMYKQQPKGFGYWVSASQGRSYGTMLSVNVPLNELNTIPQVIITVLNNDPYAGTRFLSSSVVPTLITDARLSFHTSDSGWAAVADGNNVYLYDRLGSNVFYIN